MKKVLSPAEPTIAKIENRPYGPDSTPAEIEAIKSRVSIYEEGVVHVKELPCLTPFSIKVIMGQAYELGSQFEKFGLIMDIRNCNRPDANSRREIANCFERSNQLATHMAFCIGKNVFMKIALKFILYSSKYNSNSIHMELEDAVKAIKKSLNE